MPRPQTQTAHGIQELHAANSLTCSLRKSSHARPAHPYVVFNEAWSSEIGWAWKAVL